MKKKVLIIAICLFIILFISVFLVLKNNKTFFNNVYIGVDKQKIFIPKYSYFDRECCMTAASFYSLRNEKKLNKEIEDYMKDFKYFEDDTTYGYKKGDLFIQSYEVENHLFYRKIIIVY